MRTKLVLLSLLLSSCGYLHTPVLSPYKMDIRQGNYVTPEMREKLKLGMSRSQVRYVLGTPMVSDPFHANRWDYVYRLEHEGEIVEKQQLTVYFEGDNLVRVDDGGKTIVDMPVMAKAVEEIKPVAKADPAADVAKRVEGWAAAWSAKDVAGYLAAYTSDYAPQGMSRAAWEKQRQARIAKPKTIEVALSDVSVSMQDDSHATVTFTQGYRSDAYRDEVQKTLSLVKQGDNWLIADERVGKFAPPAAKPAASGAAEEGVQLAVKLWAEAWAARDVGQYLSSYAANFKPAGMSRAKWEAQRKERIGKAQSIAVEVSELKVELRDDSHATATFRQDYRSDSYKDSTRKTLKLEKAGNVWLIVAEQAAK
jgi:outer membrane protein assembly factor BamE